MINALFNLKSLTFSFSDIILIVLDPESVFPIRIRSKSREAISIRIHLDPDPKHTVGNIHKHVIKIKSSKFSTSNTVPLARELY